MKFFYFFIMAALSFTFISCGKDKKDDNQVCTEDELRCSESNVEICTDNAWVLSEDCVSKDQVCAEDDGTVQCVSLPGSDDDIIPDNDEAGPDEDEIPDEDNPEPLPDEDEATDEDLIIPCTGISISLSNKNPDSKVFVGDVSSIGDENKLDAYMVEFYTGGLAPGSYDLSLDGNNNYATCSQCIRVFEDVVSGVEEKQYFQETGSMTIDTVTSDVMTVASVAKVKLVEVTVESGTFISTPVENGACLEIEAGDIGVECTSSNQDTACPAEKPVCNTEYYGCVECINHDNCGENQMCNLDTNTCYETECEVESQETDCTDTAKPVCNPETKLCVECVGNAGCIDGDICNTDKNVCEEPTVCTGISIESIYPTQKNIYNGSIDATLGGADIDGFQMRFMATPSTGDIDLSEQADFTACDQCLMIFEDIGGSSGVPQKLYFQESGTLTFDTVNTDELGAQIGQTKGSITDVTLRQIDPANSYKYISNGPCLEIATSAWDTLPECAVESEDTDCSEPTPACDITEFSSVCVECTSNDHCTNGQVCDTIGNNCFDPECMPESEAADCTDASKPRCKVGPYECVQCIEDEDCSNGDICNPDTNACEIPKTCTGISIDSTQSLGAGNFGSFSYGSTYTPGTGGDDPDQLIFQFWGSYDPTDEPVTIDLSEQTDFLFCNECVYIEEDVVFNSPSKTYFQQSGTMTIESILTPGKMGAFSKGALSNVKLVEIDENHKHVFNGDCIEIETAAWQLDPECLSNDECADGKVCDLDTYMCMDPECSLATEDTDCTEEGKTHCNESIGKCVECTSNEHCSEEMVCYDDNTCKLPLAPDNTCDDPETLTEINASGEFAADTSAASGYIYEDSYTAPCTTYLNGADKAYKLVLTEQSDVVIDVTAAPGSDSMIWIGSACGQGDIACNDDKPEGGYLSKVSVDSLAAGTYFVIIDSYGAETTGQFTFTVSVTPN